MDTTTIPSLIAIQKYTPASCGVTLGMTRLSLSLPDDCDEIFPTIRCHEYTTSLMDAKQVNVMSSDSMALMELAGCVMISVIKTSDIITIHIIVT